MATTLYPEVGSAAGMSVAGVQLTWIDVPDVERAAENVPGVGLLSPGPAGQPPMPGPPASPYSAMVSCCRLASASSTCQAMARSPRLALAAIFAVCRSSAVGAVAGSRSASNRYVATKVTSPVAEVLNSSDEEYPPLAAGVIGPGAARTSRLPTPVSTSAGSTIRCSIWFCLTSAPTWPVTVTLLPSCTASPVTNVSATVVSPASWTPGKLICTTSPGRMSGVTLRFVPAPQQ